MTLCVFPIPRSFCLSGYELVAPSADNHDWFGTMCVGLSLSHGSELRRKYNSHQRLIASARVLIIAIQAHDSPS